MSVKAAKYPSRLICGRSPWSVLAELKSVKSKKNEKQESPPA